MCGSGEDDGEPRKLTIAAALSAKNSIQGYIRNCADILKRENSISEGNSRECNMDEVYIDWIDSKSYLVELVSAIMEANAKSGACRIIKQIAELKDTISTLGALDTKHGKHTVEVGRYSEESAEKIFDSHLRQVFVDRKIQELELKIRKCEADLATLNGEPRIDSVEVASSWLKL